MKYEGKAIAVIVVRLPGGLLYSCPNIPVGIYDKTAITMKTYDVSHVLFMSHLVYVLIYIYFKCYYENCHHFCFTLK